MILEALAKALRSPTPEERRLRDLEIVVVYDHIQGAGRFSCPVEELYGNLPTSCRHSPNMMRVRTIGAVVGACLAVPIMYGVFIPLMGVITAPIPGVLFGSFIGGIVGWGAAPRYAPKPYWITRRIYVPGEPGSNGDTGSSVARIHAASSNASIDQSHHIALADGMRRYLIPWEHTHLLGPPSLPVAAPDSREIEPGLQMFANGGGSGGGGGIAVADKLVDIMPVVKVHRATNLYHILEAVDEKADLRASGLSTWDKIKVGSMVTIAFAVLGILILLFLITQDPAGAA